MILKPLLAACALAAVAACRTVPERQDRPAVLAQPVELGRSEVVRAASAALGGVPVTLADDALMRESTLVLERARHRDPSGLLVEGRDRGMPERFHLVKNGAQCVLVHERSGKRFPLQETACSPI